MKTNYINVNINSNINVNRRAVVIVRVVAAVVDNSSLNTTHSARNLGFIFDEHLTFSDQISSLSKSCYSHIRQLRCIRPYLDFKTASTIAASIVHSKLDYCNSLYYNLPKSQINPLQLIQNCLARTVVKAPKSSLVTPILRSLHWLKINERIELLSLTYKVLTTSQPDYLHNLISVQSTGRTRSSSLVTLARPSVPYLPHYKSPTALSHMHHLTCGISSPFHSVNLILFTVLLVHLILHISPHHSHHLRYHHLSMPLPFTPDLKLICFTNPFLHSHSHSFRTALYVCMYVCMFIRTSNHRCTM